MAFVVQLLNYHTCPEVPIKQIQEKIALKRGLGSTNHALCHPSCSPVDGFALSFGQVGDLGLFHLMDHLCFRLCRCLCLESIAGIKPPRIEVPWPVEPSMSAAVVVSGHA